MNSFVLTTEEHRQAIAKVISWWDDVDPIEAGEYVARFCHRASTKQEILDHFGISE